MSSLIFEIWRKQIHSGLPAETSFLHCSPQILVYKVVTFSTLCHLVYGIACHWIINRNKEQDQNKENIVRNVKHTPQCQIWQLIWSKTKNILVSSVSTNWCDFQNKKTMKSIHPWTLNFPANNTTQQRLFIFYILIVIFIFFLETASCGMEQYLFLIVKMSILMDDCLFLNLFMTSALKILFCQFFKNLTLSTVARQL